MATERYVSNASNVMIQQIMDTTGEGMKEDENIEKDTGKAHNDAEEFVLRQSEICTVTMTAERLYVLWKLHKLCTKLKTYPIKERGEHETVVDALNECNLSIKGVIFAAFSNCYILS